MTNAELAEKDYQKNMKYKEIAEKYKVSLSTVKSWKTRYGWQRGAYKSKKRVRADKNVCNSTQVKKKLYKSIEKSELSEKQKLFCLYYTDCLNATTAYVRAYGGKRTTGASEGWKLLARKDVQKEVKRLKEIKYQSLMLKADDIVERQMRIAFSDMTDFLTVDTAVAENGYEYNKILVHKSDQLDGAVIQEVKETKDGVAIKLKDSQKALDWLTKYFNLFPQDKHKIDFDNCRLELEKKRLDASNGGDEHVNLVVDDDI